MKHYCDSKESKKVNQATIDIMRSIIVFVLLTSAILGFYDLRREVHDIKKQINENTETILFELDNDNSKSEKTGVTK